MTTQNDLQWLSPLGLSVFLFLLYGFLYIAIGMLTPFFLDYPLSKKSGLIISYRTDNELFGEDPQKIFKENAAVYKLRQICLSMIAGLLVLCGVCISSIAWFGLRNGQNWAIIVLAMAGVIVLPFWWLVFRQYWEAGITITLADAPPFIWVPTLLFLPATILGWIGLK